MALLPFANAPGSSGGGACGVSGVPGACGVSGVSGVPGTNGACGVSGVAGACGVSGTAGTNGACGVSGVAGTNGTNGTNGACGVSGVAGACGVSGTAGTNGACGVSGVSGVSGVWASNETQYSWISSTSATGAATGQINFNSATLASVTDVYFYNADAFGSTTWSTFFSDIANTGTPVEIYDVTSSAYLIGTVSGSVTSSASRYTVPFTYVASSGTFSASDVIRIGFGGAKGACGVSGVSGISGVTGVPGACGVSGIAGTNGACGVSGVAGACGVSGTAGSAGACGVSGVAGACGVSGTAGSAGACGVSGVSGVPGAVSSVANSDGTLTVSPTTGAVVASIALSHANTWSGEQTFGLIAPNAVLPANNAVSVTSNAGTCSVSYYMNTFTNSSAGTMAITIATSGATDGQPMMVRIYDFSGVAETIGWTNTENSGVSAPLTSNGSTTLPLTVGFVFNSQTTKWRCVAYS